MLLEVPQVQGRSVSTQLLGQAQPHPAAGEPGSGKVSGSLSEQPLLALAPASLWPWLLTCAGSVHPACLQLGCPVGLAGYGGGGEGRKVGLGARCPLWLPSSLLALSGPSGAQCWPVVPCPSLRSPTNLATCLYEALSAKTPIRGAIYVQLADTDNGHH